LDERRPILIRAFRIAASLLALLVLVQALIAGQFIAAFDPDLVNLHEMVGNTLFVVSVLVFILAFLTRHSWRYQMAVWSLVTVVLVVVQTGLGYIGRDERDAVAVHIPLGVFIFSLTSIVAMLAMMDERAKAALRGEQ
jgi:ABC-type uncharacterized transport system permease subunit